MDNVVVSDNPIPTLLDAGTSLFKVSSLLGTFFNAPLQVSYVALSPIYQVSTHDEKNTFVALSPIYQVSTHDEKNTLALGHDTCYVNEDLASCSMAFSDPTTSSDLVFAINDEFFEALTLDEYVVEPLDYVPIGYIDSFHDYLPSLTALKEDSLAQSSMTETVGFSIKRDAFK